MAFRLRGQRTTKDPDIVFDDPRVSSWETVSTFADRDTAVAWRDQLRNLGIDAACSADHPLDRFGGGDVYLVVPDEQWSRASEIIDNLE